MTSSPATAHTAARRRRDGERLADFAALQRDEQDRGGFVHRWDVPFHDGVHTEVEVSGGVAAQVSDAAAPDRSHRTTVQGIPTGGPYDITLILRDASGAEVAAHRAAGVLVGDIWVLAGQSNMMVAHPGTEPDPHVTMLGMNRAWQPAVEPLHRTWVAADRPVYERLLRDCNLPEQQVVDYFTEMPPQVEMIPGGLGTFFSRNLHALTGVPIGLIPCALGGAALEWWTKGYAARKGWPEEDGLFENMVSLVRQAGGRVRGILWWQGESDAFLHLSDTYLERFSAFVASVREELGDPQLPFVTVQIGASDPWPAADAPWLETEREMQRRAAATLERVTVVAAADLPRYDPTHVDTTGQARLGARLARAATRFVPGAPEVFPVPSLRQATVSDDGGSVVVTFAGVTGTLRLTDGVGFADCFRVDGAGIAGGECDGDRVVLRLTAPVQPGAQVTYGLGNHCPLGLLDAADMPMPLFGPLPLAAPSTAGRAS